MIGLPQSHRWSHVSQWNTELKIVIGSVHIYWTPASKARPNALRSVVDSDTPLTNIPTILYYQRYKHGTGLNSKKKACTLQSLPEAGSRYPDFSKIQWSKSNTQGTAFPILNKSKWANGDIRSFEILHLIKTLVPIGLDVVRNTRRIEPLLLLHKLLQSSYHVIQLDPRIHREFINTCFTLSIWITGLDI